MRVTQPGSRAPWQSIFALATGFLLSSSSGFTAPGTSPTPPLPGVWGPTDSIVFCTRLLYDDPHWYANIGYYCDDENKKAYTGNGQPDDSRLLKLDLATGKLETLLNAQGGSIRDPQVHYDAQRILFSYRPAQTDFYHLYEINVDGSNLRQITDGPFDDYEATYLPDGDIAFVTTRCRRWVNCWMTQVGVIYRCDPQGGNLHAISANTEHDNTPWMLPDGRLLYTRWEYVDRSQVEFHHLWTMNPDGTGQAVYYGNLHPHTLMIDAKPVPGSDRVVASFSPGHGRNEHNGRVTVVTPQAGPDEPAAAQPIHGDASLRDPFALSTDSFLAARRNQIVHLVPGEKTKALYTHPGPALVHEPRPIVPRPRERVLPSRVNPQRKTGTMILADIYEGRNLPGVRRGEIKKLLVLESLPKQVNFSGGPDLTSWLGTFTLERALGTVPVEPDGSAHFELPANRQFFFVALDENDLSVKRMQSFTSVMPGETVGCVGCHEHRTQPPAVPTQPRLLALRRPASQIRPFSGHPDVLDFQRDIQPILDAHCVECHGYAERNGPALLGNGLGLHWSHSYFSLLALRQIGDGRNGLGNQPPRSLGSSASPLLNKVDGSHNDVTVSDQEWRTLWLWIESGAPYAGSYAALRNAEQQAHVGKSLAPIHQVSGILHQRCNTCHTGTELGSTQPMRIPYDPDLQQRRQIAGRPTAMHERIIFENDPIARYSINVLINLTDPEDSPLLLAPLKREAKGWGQCPDVFQNKQDRDYQLLLAALRQSKERFDSEPRYGTPGFQPNRQYLRELERFKVLAQFDQAASAPRDVFALDQAYWRSLWHDPPAAR